jgi:hypothetical protein
MIKANVIALAAIATFAAGSVAAQGMPTTPSTGPSSSTSTSTSSPSTGAAAGGSGYLSSPNSASASASATTGGDKFSGLDKDHDGMVSKSEARKDRDLGKQFDTLDTNKDGKLDSSEFSAFEVGSPIK